MHLSHPALLADISSLIPILSINILTINPLHLSTPPILLPSHHTHQINPLQSILNTIQTIKLTKLTHPKLPHPLPLPHQRYIHPHPHHKNTFPFQTHHLPLLLHFIPQLFKKQPH
ncbi:DUF3388 domain-containing protein, partial [Bacillus altitudinis]|uniref:DUF3388 domain-containing protein n=1 Tax=Bacillus altitudinis TaxID=293387 RepID=UPI003B5275F7